LIKNIFRNLIRKKNHDVIHIFLNKYKPKISSSIKQFTLIFNKDTGLKLNWAGGWVYRWLGGCWISEKITQPSLAELGLGLSLAIMHTKSFMYFYQNNYAESTLITIKGII
jgi:hypothetical protein